MNILKTLSAIMLMSFFIAVVSCNYLETAEGNYSKGLEYAAQGKFKKAQKEFEKALENKPNDISTRESLKVIKDVLNKRVQEEAAIHFF